MVWRFVASMAIGVVGVVAFSMIALIPLVPTIIVSMALIYEWRNIETGEVVEHNHWSIPPDESGNWRRVFSFGTGRVEGAGGSPALPSTRLKGSRHDNDV